MVESNKTIKETRKDNRYNSTGNTVFSASGTSGTVHGIEFEEFTWDGKEDTELQKEVKSVFSKIRQEREIAEQKIYEAIKSFEWSTGIKIIKLDFEISRDKVDSRVKIVLERI